MESQKCTRFYRGEFSQSQHSGSWPIQKNGRVGCLFFFVTLLRVAVICRRVKLHFIIVHCSDTWGYPWNILIYFQVMHFRHGNMVWFPSPLSLTSIPVFVCDAHRTRAHVRDANAMMKSLRWILVADMLYVCILELSSVSMKTWNKWGGGSERENGDLFDPCIFDTVHPYFH